MRLRYFFYLLDHMCIHILNWIFLSSEKYFQTRIQFDILVYLSLVGGSHSKQSWISLTQLACVAFSWDSLSSAGYSRSHL